ncbi:MAG: tRNA sulfurtransferase [Caldisericia bacterium]|nr:tRNA sulfurtransferase [Caldisericia bacterium]
MINSVNDTYDLLIIRYGEIFLKSKPVKKRFEQILDSRLRWKLDKSEIKDNYKLRCWQNTFYLYGTLTENLIDLVTNTFGVLSVSPALQCQPTIPDVKKTCKRFRKILGSFTPKSYRVSARKDKRLSTSHFTFEYEAAYYFQDWEVSLRNPEFTVHVDAKENNCLIYSEKRRGPGGFPYGAQEKAIALISRGIDSPVAAWLMGKRGCKLVLLYLGENPPIEYRNILEKWAGSSIPMITVPFTEYTKSLREKGSGKFQCIFCKKTMYIVAEKIAKKIYAKGIVSGENLGQVASQTLSNLSELSSAVELPVFRPVLTYDKNQIIQLAKYIGTFGMYQQADCEFVPSQPATSLTEKKRFEMNRILNIHEEAENYFKENLDE